MKVVDSSGWLEFFADGPLADTYAAHLTPLDALLTPTIVLYEVYKFVKRNRSEADAEAVAAVLQATEVVELSPALALYAAELSITHRLAMADAMIYATALSRGAILVTSDDDFEKLPGVIYLPKE